MTWLIIILAAAFVLGPILYLKPSARDKRLASLRQRAQQLGLSVKLAQISRLDPDAGERVSAAGEIRDPQLACVAYRRCHESPLTNELPDVVLLRIPAAPTVGSLEVVSGWALQGGAAHVWAAAAKQLDSQALQQWLADLPSEVLAIGIDVRFASCFWLENASLESGLVDQIAASLQQFSTILIPAPVA